MIQDKETVVMPRRPDAVSRSPTVTLTMLRVLEFSSQTLRSGMVVESRDAPRGAALLFLRGAPAVMKSLVDPASVPADFQQVRHLTSTPLPLPSFSWLADCTCGMLMFSADVEQVWHFIATDIICLISSDLSAATQYFGQLTQSTTLVNRL